MTIIILLILAGVTLALISGSDGVLGRATSAVDENKRAMAKEQVELAIGDFQATFFDEKYVERTSDGEKKEYISEKLMAGVETTDFYTKATADGTVKVYDLGKVENGKEVVIGAIEKDGSINWDGKQIADSGNGGALEARIDQLEKQVEDLKTTVLLLETSHIGKMKLIKRDWAPFSRSVTGSTELESVSLAGYGSGKAVISFSVAAGNINTTKMHGEIRTNTGGYASDISIETSNSNYLGASPSLSVEYSENTVVRFWVAVNSPLVPTYSYSILLIPEE